MCHNLPAACVQLHAVATDMVRLNALSLLPAFNERAGAVVAMGI
jgi:hypothetical protein